MSNVKNLKEREYQFIFGVAFTLYLLLVVTRNGACVFSNPYTTEIREFSLLPWNASIIDELLVFMLISVIALGMYQNKKGITRIKIKKTKEKLLWMNELGFIKNQFNSHVTFNFLNYCYSKVHKDSTETSEAIEVFSKMLRYSMSCRLGEKVLLSKEIEYMEDFIRLQKLLQEELKIVFFKNGAEQVYILPRILIHFTEHVFKQGNLNASKLPVFIELQSCEKWINLTIESEKRINNRSGIDQKTLSDHLDLLYKNSYVLETEETYASYKFRLKLMI